MSTKQITVPSISKEPVQVKVALRRNGRAIDPTIYDVDLAAVSLDATPDTGDWIAGTWDTDGNVYHAEILVSGTGYGGDMAKDAGVYDLWVRIAELTSVPARKVGTLVIT